MSAIIDRIDIELTPEQHKQIRAFWHKHFPHDGDAMLAVQPLGKGYRDWYTGKPILRCALMDSTLAKAVNQTLIEHRKERP